MASNYTGNPNATQAPGPTPAPGAIPIISIPAGTDVRTIESISQALKESVDYIAYIQTILRLGIPSTATTVPQLRVVDASGNTRYIVDHNGFPTAYGLQQFSDQWLVSPGSNANVWTTVLGTAAAIATQNPSASYNARYLLITPSSTSGVANYALAYSSMLFLCNTSAMSLVLEFDIGLNTAAAGTTSNTSWFVGFDNGFDPLGSDLSLVGLRKKYNAVNYDLLSGNGSLVGSAATSPATPPTVGTVPVDRVRIEIQGATSAYGAYQARFLVNNVAVGTVAAANMPGATAMRFVFGCANEGGAPSGSPLGYLGPVNIMWNRVGSPAAL